MTEYSTAYLAAWHRLMAKGMDFAAVTERDIAALSSDPATKRWVDQELAARSREQQKAAATLEAARPAPSPAPDPARARFHELVKDDSKNLDALLSTMAKEYPMFAVPVALLDVIVKDLTSFAEAMNSRNQARNERLDLLEQRVKELEAAPKALRYRGIFSGDDVYALGDTVTHASSMWTRVGLRDKHARPGQSPDWMLSVKGAGR